MPGQAQGVSLLAFLNKQSITAPLFQVQGNSIPFQPLGACCACVDIHSAKLSTLKSKHDYSRFGTVQQVEVWVRGSPADAGDHGGAWLLPFPVWLQLGVRAALRSFLVDLFVPKIKLRETCV